METLNKSFVSIVLQCKFAGNYKMTQEQEILIKATDLFFQYGIRSVTMDDISKELGISKKTLYLFVDNKSDLVKKALEIHMLNQKEGIVKIKDEAENAIEEITSVAKLTLKTLKSMHPSSLYDIEKYYPESWQIIEQYKSDFIYNLLVSNAENGKKEGLYRDSIDNHLAARFYTFITEQLVLPSNFPSTKFNFLDLYKQFISYHLHGIASRKGLDYLKTIDLENE